MVDTSKESIKTAQKIGEKIKNLRKERNLSQKALGDMLGISPAFLSKYELGDLKQPFEILVHLSRVLNIDISEFSKLVPRRDKK